MTSAEKQITEKEAIACLNAIFSGWQLLECLDVIADTSLYRHSLKLRMRQLMPELEKLVDEIAMFFDVDPHAMNNLIEHKKELNLKIIAMRPENQAGLNELLAAFFNAPELTLHRLGIKIE